MSLMELAKEFTNGNSGAGWARTAVIIMAFGVMLWFDPRIGFMQSQIADNAASIKVMDGQGTRHSSQAEIEIKAAIASNTEKIKRLEDRFEKIDNTLTAILNRLPEKTSSQLKQ